MKKIYSLSALVLILVMTSCTMEKRHYRNGFHVSWNHNTTNSPEKPVVSATDENIVLSSIAETQSGVTVISSAENSIQLTKAINSNLTPTLTPAQSIASALPTVTPETQSVTPNKTKIAAADSQHRGSENQNSSQPDEVLLVILAILLPPLAMYLYEGSSWTSRCTLNLILTLLCGLPGMIHALIVILGKK